MQYRFECNSIKSTTRKIKKVLKKLYTKDNIRIVDIDKWILEICVEDVRRGYCISLTPQDTPSLINSVEFPSKKQGELLGDIYKYRVLQFSDDCVKRLYSIHKKVYVHPNMSYLSKDDKEMFFDAFIHDYSSIIVDVFNEDVDDLLSEIKKLKLIGVKIKILPSNKKRLTFRMPYWRDWSLDKNNRSLSHDKVNYFGGRPSVVVSSMDSIRDNCKFTNTRSISLDVDVAQSIVQREKYGGTSVRHQKI